MKLTFATFLLTALFSATSASAQSLTGVGVNFGLFGAETGQKAKKPLMENRRAKPQYSENGAEKLFSVFTLGGCTVLPHKMNVTCTTRW